MIGIIHYETFIISSILLNISPGNDTIFIVSKSVAQGKKAGVVSVLGISSGILVHTTLAALGLSLIIAKSILVFNLIKLVGSAYLIFIGIRMLYPNSSFLSALSLPSEKINYRRIYRDAILTNIFNPKVALFFIAFLPQFIDMNQKEGILPFLLLGITFAFTGTIWCLLLANFSALLFSKLKSSQRISSLINKVSGSVLIALGIKVAFSRSN